MLAGFHEPKDDHIYIKSFKPNVGYGEDGYNKIVEAFQSSEIGGLASVIVVNPINEKWPCLVLIVYCICICFDSK